MIGRRMKTMGNKEKICELIQKYDRMNLEPRMLIGRTHEEIQRDHTTVVDGIFNSIIEDLSALYEEELKNERR